MDFGILDRQIAKMASELTAALPGQLVGMAASLQFRCDEPRLCRTAKGVAASVWVVSSTS
jgi:hypothetical protein